MDILDVKAELEKLHHASFGWALSCCRRNRTDAEDVLQIVYLKILEGKARYRGEAKLQTWLFAVIRKTAISEHRKTLLRALKSIGNTPLKSARGFNLKTTRGSLNLEPEVEFERSQMQQRFLQALDDLPARQRETLHLVFYQDMSLREAAQVMGVSIGSARRHYDRGKKRLREALEREEFEYGVTWKPSENSGAVL